MKIARAASRAGATSWWEDNAMTAGKPGLLLEPKERLRFETLIADLSSEFVNLPSASVDRRIEDAQRRVCECLGLEQSTLWECSVEAPHTFTLTHLYRSQGGPPTLEPMEASECFPWCQRQALAGKVIAVSSMEDLPTEASRDRETWLHYGIKSNLTLPLSAGGGPTIGALSFGTVRAERTWPESIVKRLQLVSQVFANALVGKRAEEASRIEEKRLRSVVRITQQKATSLRELLDKALEEAIALSDSKLGYIYYYNEGQQEFTLHAWSREAMEECAIPNPPTVYRLDKTGLWGEAVRQRRPIVVNDFSAPNPLKKGYPPGHAPLFRYMTLPVLCDGHIVAVVGVANRARDYTEMDVQQLTMMMDSVWEVAERKRAEEAVRVLAGKLLTAQEAERSLIAREMHDDLTQRIAVLAIEAGKLEQASAASESLSGRLREM
jgi:GAF domain-containing protein